MRRGKWDKATAGRSATQDERTRQQMASLAWWLIGAALVVGLLARIWLVGVAPRYGYYNDHDDFARWGIQAADTGVTSLYREMPPRWDYVRYRWDGSSYVNQRAKDRLFNYPPLAGYVIWAQGKTHKLFSADRRLNTVLARAVYAVPSMVASLALALACRAIVLLWAGRVAGAAAFAVTFLCPPLMLDGAFWGQTDAWVLAPGLWMVWAMLRRRWLMAGVLWGVAMGLKTQGVLLGSLWAFAVLFDRDRFRALAGMAVAGVVLNVTALPYWLTSGTAWITYGFTDNLLHQYQFTTLRAFNVWYIDLLLTGKRDSSVTLLGVTRDMWGRALFGLAALAGFVIAWRRWQSEPYRLLLLGGWILLVVVMFPTRVHERYLVLCLPLLICGAFRVRRLWVGLVVLMLVATCQITARNWGTFLADQGTVQDKHQRYVQRYVAAPPQIRRAMPTPDQQRTVYQQQKHKDATREWMLVLLALGATAWTLTLLGRYRGVPQGVPPQDSLDQPKPKRQQKPPRP